MHEDKRRKCQIISCQTFRMFLGTRLLMIMKKEPFVSVVIPVKNGGNDFELCLKGLRKSDYGNYELIVVNDSSTDNTVQIAEKYGATVLHCSDFFFKHKSDFPYRESIGPAGARNIGARHAKGNIIFFIDSDVVPKKDNINRIIEVFKKKGNIAAVFGTYDNNPGCQNFISQYKNLLHTYVHQTSLAEAETFWAACGAIKKDIFLKMEGFDLKTFRLPSVEDIDLGYRLKDANHRIYLDKGLQVKHLKQWTFKSMLKTDVFHRAIPWTRIMFQRKHFPKDLNLQTHHRTSGIMVLMISILMFLILGSTIIKFWQYAFWGRNPYYNGPLLPISLLLVVGLLITVVFLNYKLYWLFLKRKGVGFMLKSIPLHLFYYLYSTVTFIVVIMDNSIPLFKKIRKKP